ncbi:MAG: heavy-metal-associated domain-containing protein [Acidobacteria bacterium]|nr:heavy-metal-associated domain-containing protein [Acidobacteriota bacterium]MBI3663908.1 heavy-metal-associated domain-containing protein [Acidobacteriota bacterium]
MNEKPLAIGSTLAAFLASLCCLGPLVLGGLGLGAASVATFAPLRPYFLAVSGVLLAAGFYSVYRKPKAAPSCAGENCAPESHSRRLAKPLLWLATLAVAALALFPSYGARLVSQPAVAGLVTGAGLETMELKINGMTCEACAEVVKRKLLETPGVAGAEVDFALGKARVKFAPAQTDAGKLVAAVNSTGYKASAPDARPK